MVLIAAVCLAVALGAATVVRGAADHASPSRSYTATFHDAYVSGEPTHELHRGTFKITITKGSTALSRIALAVAAKLGLKDVLKGSYVAYVDAPDNSDAESGTVLIRPTVRSVGTACMTFTGTFDDQSNIVATWKSAGGTGMAATLHGSGKVKSGVPLVAATGTGTVRLGPAAHMRGDCTALVAQH